MKELDLSLVFWLHTLGLNLSHIKILGVFKRGRGDELPKHKLVNDLVRGGYILEGEVTEKGDRLIQDYIKWDKIWEPSPKLIRKRKVDYSQQFLEFWGEYPSSDNIFGWTGIRDLKQEKLKCSEVYEEVSEKYGHEAILEALRVEVSTRKLLSTQENKNQFLYMNNTYNWLKKEKFKNFLGKEMPKDDNRVINNQMLF